MGLHQKIIDRTESEPCDCPADDDHVEVNEDAAHESETIALEESRWMTSDWTDGTEADE